MSEDKEKKETPTQKAKREAAEAKAAQQAAEEAQAKAEQEAEEAKAAQAAAEEAKAKAEQEAGEAKAALESAGADTIEDVQIVSDEDLVLVKAKNTFQCKGAKGETVRVVAGKDPEWLPPAEAASAVESGVAEYVGLEADDEETDEDNAE